MNNVYDALEICLQEMERGADVDTVLFRYPEFAEELRPILETAAKAKNAVLPDPAPDVVRRNRAKVLQHAAQIREASSQPARGFWSILSRRALVSLAVIAMLFISGTGLVRAASTTLPGDNLYPVKRTWEDMRVLFTFDVRAREALEVEHENERLEELSELFREGRSTKVDFVGIVTRQDGDVWLVSTVKVMISAQTDLHDGSIAAGDAVRVRGVTRSDWTVLAERVDLLEAGVPLPDLDDGSPEFEPENNGNENEGNESPDGNSGPGSGNDSNDNSDFDPEEVSLEGTVDSVNGNIVVVDGKPMNISTAEVRGTPAAGRRVKVEGYYNASGIFIVTRIEFLEDNSGGDNSDSNDNDNDSNDTGNDNNDDSNDNDDNDDDHSGSGGGGDDDNDDGDSGGSGGGGDDDDDD